jgi:hypothetical protein
MIFCAVDTSLSTTVFDVLYVDWGTLALARFRARGFLATGKVVGDFKAVA